MIKTSARSSGRGAREEVSLIKNTFFRVPRSASRAFVLMLISVSFAHASESQLKEGNRLFWNGHYEDALKKYNDALIDAPDSSSLRFNAGDAAYQMGSFSEAEKQFQETGDRTPVPGLRSAARYNQGNALYRQGKWKEAVDAYKDALRANPQDEDAKYNLGVALQTMKNPPKPKPQSGQGKPDQKKGDRDKSKGNGMSKEDAERLLAAAGAGEKKKPNAKAQKPGAPHPDEDW
jgi:Ca-activated chloride channel family protein